MSSYLEKKATALGFDASKDRAPRVLAQGSGYMAAHMIRLAEESGVTVIEDPELCAVTHVLPVNSEIPENLYTAVAALLGMVMRMKGEAHLQR